MTQDFLLWIERLATATGRKPEDLLTYWRDYYEERRRCSRIPMPMEFCRWHDLPELPIHEVTP